MKVDVIIPTYKPNKELFQLLDSLNSQTVFIHQIILINTEQQYFEQLTKGSDFFVTYKNVTVKHISKEEFDHGRSRNDGVKCSEAEYFVMMTQDAIPADNFLIEELLLALKKDKTAIAYARQLPTRDSDELEKFMRGYNYPDMPMYKTQEDVERLGIKAYFASNVCAAYNRDYFDELGGFVNHTIFNEDMIYACKAIRAGYGVAYQPAAKVFHSHQYTNKQQFHRNFDLGVSHADYPEVFLNISSESEGIKMIQIAIRHLIVAKKPWLIIKLIVQSGYKYLGYFMGKRYRKWSPKWVSACSMNKEYWKV